MVQNRISHITTGEGGEFQFVNKISEFMNLNNVKNNIVVLNPKEIFIKRFFDEGLIPLSKFRHIKDSTDKSQIIFFHCIYTYSFLVILLYLKIFCKKNIITIFHNNNGSNMGSFFRQKYSFLRKFIIINLVSIFSDRLIFLTNVQKIDYENICLFKETLFKKDRVINNFVEKDKILKSKKGTCKKLKVLFVGRLSFSKGFHNFLELIRIFKSEGVSFSTIGEDSLRGKIKKTHITGLVYFGAVKNKRIYGYYDKNNIFILPSYSEVFPMTILEAMARGLVVLVSDIPGMREIIKEGRNGYLFPPGDIEKMKEIILYLKDNPKEIERISKNNLKDIWKFTAEKQVPKYIKAYKEVLREK